MFWGRGGRREPASPILLLVSLWVTVLIAGTKGEEMAKSLRIGLCQWKVGMNKSENVDNALRYIREAAQKGAKLIVLPECFNSPYGTKFFPKYAETMPDGPTSLAMADVARELDVTVMAGSIPEKDGDSLYNTCAVWGPKGTMLAKFRKIHLFKINTEKVKFDESETLTAGESPATFSVGGWKVGVGICFDVRYPEMAEYYRQQGTDLLVYPGAFNMVTGPVHWELAARSRSVDAQQYVALCSPARDEEAASGYVAYGHSLVSNPWGEVEGMGAGEGIHIQDLSAEEIASVRSKLPISEGKRNHLFATESEGKAGQSSGGSNTNWALAGALVLATTLLLVKLK